MNWSVMNVVCYKRVCYELFCGQVTTCSNDKDEDINFSFPNEFKFSNRNIFALRGVTTGGKIPRAPDHYGGAESLRGAPNVCSQVLSSIQ